MNRLKFWRIERNLSQIELSQSSGVPRHVIQLAEQGIRLPPCEYQLDLAESLGVTVEELFSNSIVKESGDEKRN